MIGSLAIFVALVVSILQIACGQDGGRLHVPPTGSACPYTFRFGRISSQSAAQRALAAYVTRCKPFRQRFKVEGVIETSVGHLHRINNQESPRPELPIARRVPNDTDVWAVWFKVGGTVDWNRSVDGRIVSHRRYIMPVGLAVFDSAHGKLIDFALQTTFAP